jgi:hypothetical protein
MDGLSDMSIVATEAISGFANIVGGRIKSLLKYKLKDKFEPLINKVLAMIPENIDLPYRDLYLHNTLSNIIKIKSDNFI